MMALVQAHSKFNITCLACRTIAYIPISQVLKMPPKSNFRNQLTISILNRDRKLKLHFLNVSKMKLTGSQTR